jgi:hypothetical protein
MRVPIFRVVNDDDQMDYQFPCGVSLDTLRELRDEGDPTYFDVCDCAIGQSVTVGGGAAVQFTLTRIR